MEKKYFGVRVYTSKTHAGEHIIKAYTKKDAIRIRHKFKISHPWGCKKPIKILCTKLNVCHKDVKDLIQRRQAGFGGSVWYEDENGQLQTEKIKHNHEN